MPFSPPLASEADALDNDKDHIGAPMSDALWRTNHGYDPTIREHFEWSDGPTSNTVFRYMIIHDALQTYNVGSEKAGAFKFVGDGIF